MRVSDHHLQWAVLRELFRAWHDLCFPTNMLYKLAAPIKPYFSEKLGISQCKSRKGIPVRGWFGWDIVKEGVTE